MLNVHRTKYEVLYHSRGTVDGKVLTCAFKFNVLQADRNSFQVSDRHSHLRLRLHRKVVIFRRGISSRDRRVVTDLLADVLEARTHVFIRLTLERIERLGGATGRAGVLGSAKACYKHQSFL